jgi:hypothetical protein
MNTKMVLTVDSKETNIWQLMMNYNAASSFGELFTAGAGPGRPQI